MLDFFFFFVLFFFNDPATTEIYTLSLHDALRSDEHFLNAELLVERLPNVALRSMDALHLSIARDIGIELLATAEIVMEKAARLLEVEVIFFGK